MSSDDVHHTPWAKTLPLLEQVPFQLNRLQRVLRLNGWRPGVIRRRHFPIEPETLRQQLGRSEEHTSELQSLVNLVCRLLLEKKKHTKHTHTHKPAHDTTQHTSQ